MEFAPKYHVNKRIYDQLPYDIQERAVTSFYVAKCNGYTPQEISETDTGMPEANKMLKWIYKAAQEVVRDGEATDLQHGMQTGISYYQNYVQMKSWYRRKQIYAFDADILDELIRTNADSITLPQDVFDYLPCRSLCLDFSANERIMKCINAERAVVQVESVKLPDSDNEYHVILMSFCHGNDTNMIKALVLLKEEGSTDISIKELMDSKLGLIVSETGELPEECRPELQVVLVLSCLMYLCSYEPDIRETVVSKAKHRKAKQEKKKPCDAPNREFLVGERFGEAFRKWTKGQLGQSSEHTETGRKNKPHLRRAHWHRFWIGKRGSDERKLVIRWLSECFCGITDNEAEASLDTVKHEVNKA